MLMIAWYSRHLHHATAASKLKVLRRSSSSVLFHSFRSIQRYGHDETTHLYNNNKLRNTVLDDTDVISDVTLSTVKNPDEYCSLIEQYLYKHTREHIIEPHHHNAHVIHMLLCVSGGSDSMSMMHLLQRIKDLFQPAIQLMVVNFNHKMREESDEEVYSTYSPPLHYNA